MFIEGSFITSTLRSPEDDDNNCFASTFRYQFQIQKEENRKYWGWQRNAVMVKLERPGNALLCVFILPSFYHSFIQLPLML